MEDLGWGALGAGVLAILGISFSAVLFSRWTQVRTVSMEEADLEFAEATAEAGGGPAYVEIAPDGRVRVHRELEGSEPQALDALHLLGWEPEREGLLHVGFPMWFVQVKMSRALNLGTMTSALAGDWGNLDLTVSVEELELRGPGLVLDHRLEDGSRILLWTEAAPEE